MSLYEKDPRDTAYLALLIAIIWYKEISPESATRIAQGRSSAKAGIKPTPELREQFLRTVDNINFRSFDSVERKYKVNRYDVINSEEEFAVSQIKQQIKRIKKLIEACPGECDKCELNMDVTEERTLCMFLDDLDTDSPQTLKNRNVIQKYNKCITTNDLSGIMVLTTNRIDKKAIEGIRDYAKENPKEKMQDILSLALLEYAERHKAKK